MELRGLRDDVYRRPLATALDRLGIGPGWTCVDVGAGGGDVTVALAEIVGRDGRVYAVDSDPTTRDEVASAAAAHSQVLAITQAGEDLRLPEPVDLAFCRFLLLHVVEPAAVLARMAAATRPGGWVVAQEPITSAGRIAGLPFSMPDARHPDAGPALAAAGAVPGRVGDLCRGGSGCAGHLLFRRRRGWGVEDGQRRPDLDLGVRPGPGQHRRPGHRPI